MTLYQYAKSTAPEVVAAAEENLRRFTEFQQAVNDVSIRYTGSSDNARAHGSPTYGGSITGIVPTGQDLPGQWCKPDRDGTIKPYKANEDTKDFWVHFRALDIPGRPEIAWGPPDSNGTCMMSRGAVFILDGTVYSGWGLIPHARKIMGKGDIPSMENHGWTEITGSEWQHAANAHQVSA